MSACLPAASMYVLIAVVRVPLYSWLEKWKTIYTKCESAKPRGNLGERNPSV